MHSLVEIARSVQAYIASRDTSGLASGPQLSYGRHRGPITHNCRRAAVAVAVFEGPTGGLHVPLTLRPTSLKHHGGQISFPGGQIEPGESASQAAIREFTEELGIPPAAEVLCGELDRQFVYASNNLVIPVVFTFEKSDTWRPDASEVEEVIELPLSEILTSQNWVSTTKSRSLLRSDEEVGQISFRARALTYERHQVWGATAMILNQLAQILLRR